MRSSSPPVDLQLADLLALCFDVDRPRRIEALERLPHQAVEHLLRRLRLAGQPAEEGTAVAREALEVEDLRTARRERFQQAALAATGGAAQHPVAESRGELVELRERLAT